MKCMVDISSSLVASEAKHVKQKKTYTAAWKWTKWITSIQKPFNIRSRETPLKEDLCRQRYGERSRGWEAGSFYRNHWSLFNEGMRLLTMCWRLKCVWDVFVARLMSAAEIYGQTWASFCSIISADLGNKPCILFAQNTEIPWQTHNENVYQHYKLCRTANLYHRFASLLGMPFCWFLQILNICYTIFRKFIAYVFI